MDAEFQKRVSTALVHHQIKLADSCQKHYGCSVALGFCLNVCVHADSMKKLTDTAKMLFVHANDGEMPDDDTVSKLFADCLPIPEWFVYEHDEDMKRVLGHNYMNYKSKHPHETLEVCYDPLDASVSWGVINGDEWIEEVHRTDTDGVEFDAFVQRLKQAKNKECV